MNIVMMVTNPYSNDSRVRREAEALVEAGNHVHVISWDQHGDFPVNENISGVVVTRIQNSLLMRMMVLETFRLPFWRKKALKAVLPGVDVIHCHDLDTLPAGIKLRRKLQIPLVYDAHEIYGYMVSSDVPWWRRYIKLEKKIAPYADIVVTVCEPLQKYFRSFLVDERLPELHQKPIHVVKNCKEFDKAPYEPPTEKEFTVVYVGTLGKSREILELIDAIGKMEGIKFLIAGGGTKKKYVDAVKEHCSKTKNVKFLGKIPQDEVIPLTKRCHVSICLFERDNMNNQVGLPNKIFEAMVTGRPLITTRGLYYSDFAADKGFGVPVSDMGEFALELAKLKIDPERCRQYGIRALEASKDHNWDREKLKLLEIYKYIKYLRTQGTTKEG